MGSKAKGTVNKANKRQADKHGRKGPQKAHNRKAVSLTVDNGIFRATNRGRSNVFVATTHEEQAFAALPRRNKIAEQVTEFRAAMHELAVTHPAITELALGTTARVFADAYLVARRDVRNGTDRLDVKKVAEKLALDQLSGEDLHRVAAIAKGRGAAQRALDEAFDVVHRATIKRASATAMV